MELIIDNFKFVSDVTKCSLDGEVYFSIGETFFPMERWFDMVGFDLSNWLPDVISFCRNHSDTFLFSFMDGPYAIKLIRKHDGDIFAVCMRDNLPVIHQTKVDLAKLIRSVIACCNKYDRFLHENGKPNQFTREIRILKSILDT